MEHVELRQRLCRQRYGIYAAVLVLCVQRDQRDAVNQYVTVSQFLTHFKKSVACVGPVSVNIVVRQCFAMKTHKTQRNDGSRNKACLLFFLGGG
jgi:hypothetical protein